MEEKDIKPNIESAVEEEILTVKDVMQDFILIIQFLLGEKTRSLSHLFSRKVKIENLGIEYKNTQEISELLTGLHLQLFTYFDTLDIVGQNNYFLSQENASKLVNLYLKKDSIDDNLEWNYKNLDFLKELFIYFVSLFNNVLSEKLNQIILTDPLNINILKDIINLNLDQIENKWVYIKYNIFCSELENSITIHHVISYSVVKKLILLSRENTDNINVKGDYDQEEDLSIIGKAITTVSPIRYKSLPKIYSLEDKERNAFNNFSLLLDLKMQLTVELGRAKMKIDKILGLGEGSIIELNKLAGEPVDLFVNNNLIAKGEVVVIDQNFGVRITEIIGTNKRLENIL